MSPRCHHSLAVVTSVKYGCDFKTCANIWCCEIENVPRGENNKWSFSNPHPWTLINDQFAENLFHYCVLKPYKCDSVTPIKIPTLLLLKISNIHFTCITNMKTCLWWQILCHAVYWKLPTRRSVVKPVITWLSPLQPMCVSVYVRNSHQWFG